MRISTGLHSYARDVSIARPDGDARRQPTDANARLTDQTRDKPSLRPPVEQVVEGEFIGRKFAGYETVGGGYSSSSAGDYQAYSQASSATASRNNQLAISRALEAYHVNAQVDIRHNGGAQVVDYYA